MSPQIADLGVAAFQKWSTLTKEETKRQKSKSKTTGSSKASSGGTLSYMAPEHFKNINQKATAKSDVYSFGIVIWVILSNMEPYESKAQVWIIYYFVIYWFLLHCCNP